MKTISAPLSIDIILSITAMYDDENIRLIVKWYTDMIMKSNNVQPPDGLTCQNSDIMV